MCVSHIRVSSEIDDVIREIIRRPAPQLYQSQSMGSEIIFKRWIRCAASSCVRSMPPTVDEHVCIESSSQKSMARRTCAKTVFDSVGSNNHVIADETITDWMTSFLQQFHSVAPAAARGKHVKSSNINGFYIKGKSQPILWSELCKLISTSC